MTKRANFPANFWNEPVIDVKTGMWLPSAIDTLQTYLTSDNLPDGISYQRTKATNLLASDIPTNSDFEEFGDVAVVAYGWTGNYQTNGTPQLNRNNYRPSLDPFRGNKAQQLISPDNVIGVSVASQPFAVKEFLQYTASVRAKTDNAVAGAKGFFFRIAWYSSDADFSFAGVASTTDIVAGTDTTLSTSYQQFSGTVTAPAGAKFARIALYNWGPSKASNYFSTVTVDTVTWGLAITAWDSAAQKAAAVDANGNLLLKNLATVAGSTSGPTHTGAFAVIPEMTVTFTSKGGKVLCIFTGSIGSDTASSQGLFGIFLDGSQDSPVQVKTFPSVANLADLICISHISSPAAGSHTFDVRWRQDTGATLTASALVREFQVIELT